MHPAIISYSSDMQKLKLNAYFFLYFVFNVSNICDIQFFFLEALLTNPVVIFYFIIKILGKFLTVLQIFWLSWYYNINFFIGL